MKLSQHKGQIFLYLASFSVAGFILIYGRLTYFGDSQTYLQLASYFNPNYYWRTPGYPIVLSITGFNHFESLTGVLFLQFILCGFIPILIYHSLKLFVSEKLALIVGLLSVLSLFPYQFEKTIYPDAIHLFLCALLLYGTLRMVSKLERISLVSVLISGSLLYLFRPTLVALIIAPILLLIKHCFSSTYRLRAITFLFIVTLNISGMQMYVNSVEKMRVEISDANNMRQISFQGRQLFLNAYLNSDGNLAKALQDNSDVSKLRALLLEYFEKPIDVRKLNLATWGTLTTFERYELFGQFQGDPEGQVNSIFERPNLSYYWLLVSLADTEFPKYSDDLFRQIAFEMYFDNPSLFLRTTVRMVPPMFFGKPFTFGGTLDSPTLIPEKIAFYPFYFPTVESVEEWLPIGIKQQLTRNINAGSLPLGLALINQLWINSYRYFFLVLTLIWFLGLLLFGTQKIRTKNIGVASNIKIGYIVTSAMMIGQAFPLAILAGPQFRYQITSLPYLMCIFGFVVHLSNFSIRSLSYSK